MFEDFFTVKEVAAILKVHPNTIYRAIKKGYIVALRIGDRKKSPYRISVEIIKIIHSSTMDRLLNRLPKSM